MEERGDWFLPSKEELNLMYENLHKKGLGSFGPFFYWSSSEANCNYGALSQNFCYGNPFNEARGHFLCVRALRASNILAI